MNKHKINIFGICSVIFIVVFCTMVSAVSLPTVGGDDDAWGTILNSYLTNLAGPNATELNQTMVNGSNIYASSINTTHLLDSTITDDDISDTTNLTLGEKITFTLGEVIDNIVDGWITITGGLNATGNIATEGNVTADYFIGDGSKLTNVAGTTDTDTNVTTACTGNDQVLTSNNTCVSLNATISALDTDTNTDTTYDAEENYIYESSNTFYINETVLNATIDDRDDTSSATDYSILSYTENITNMPDDLTNFTNTPGFITSYTDTDTNVSSICSDDEVLLGQDIASCVNLNNTITDLNTGGSDGAGSWVNDSTTTNTSNIMHLLEGDEYLKFDYDFAKYQILSSTNLSFDAVEGGAGQIQFWDNVTIYADLHLDTSYSYYGDGSKLSGISASVSADSINGTELADTITLDANMNVLAGNFSINNSNLVVDISNERVSIGDTTPSAMLQVGGDTGYDGELQVCSDASRCAVLEADDSGLWIHTGSTTNHDFQIVRNDVSRIYIDNTQTLFRNSSGNNEMILKDGGKLGIGVTPTDALTVAGNINATSNNITTVDCIHFTSGGKICDSP